jgi:D-serine deaminase-like pyridoxal phosphate-dependent protein
MPVPTVYSESGFASYLASVLDTLADVLGWDAGDPRVQEAVTDALLEYGETSIAAISGSSNLLKLRALGRRSIWRAVAEATAGNYSFTDVAQQKFDRQQVHDHALAMWREADSTARTLGADVSTAVSVVTIKRPHDPYIILPDAERIP